MRSGVKMTNQVYLFPQNMKCLNFVIKLYRIMTLGFLGFNEI